MDSELAFRIEADHNRLAPLQTRHYMAEVDQARRKLQVPNSLAVLDTQVEEIVPDMTAGSDIRVERAGQKIDRNPLADTTGREAGLVTTVAKIGKD